MPSFLLGTCTVATVLVLLIPGGMAQAEEVSMGPMVQVVRDGKPGTHTLLDKASKRWRLCALLPQAQDRFFWAVAWGLTTQAKSLGVDIGVYQAGGYEKTEVQRSQLDACLKAKADAILIAATDPDAILQQLDLLKLRGLPVIDLINGLSGNTAISHVIDDFSANGEAVARHALTLPLPRPMNILWLPGPRKSLWAEGHDHGLRKVLAHQSAINLVDGGWGVTEIRTQVDLVRKGLAENEIHLVIGNAVAASIAARSLKFQPERKTRILATYANEEVIELLRSGHIDAVVTNAPVTQARLAVDIAVRALEGQSVPRRISLPGQLITKDTVGRQPYEQELAPEGVWAQLPQLPPILSPVSHSQ